MHEEKTELATPADGAMVGSVSGGCVEETLAKRYCSGKLGMPARPNFATLVAGDDSRGREATA